MLEAQRLRDQAERCMRLARSASDQQVANTLTALATEYLEKADAFERQQAATPQRPTGGPEHAVQQQQQQQQQIQPKKG
jgi:hypothetical protein